MYSPKVFHHWAASPLSCCWAKCIHAYSFHYAGSRRRRNIFGEKQPCRPLVCPEIPAGTLAMGQSLVHREVVRFVWYRFVHSYASFCFFERHWVYSSQKDEWSWVIRSPLLNQSLCSSGAKLTSRTPVPASNNIFFQLFYLFFLKFKNRYILSL